MSLPAGTPIGKYVVRRKLAEGGMAEIYLCAGRGPEGFEKEVVIKRIRAFLADDPEFVKMFIAEARLASRLNHPNVVQVYDFDKHEDTYYLAMEYVNGVSLWDVRRLCKDLMVPVPPTLVAHIGSEVARGLHYAHQLHDKGKLLGLVHRDVTPHNVLLSFDGAVKLTDFGIAKGGNKLTSPGMLKGKFAYMSPEQSRGEDVDRRSDVFGLGIVLWEMLTGGKLFDGDSDIAVLRAVQERVIPPPARLNPDVPAELDGVVMRALERDPAARYSSAQELERALAQFVLQRARTLEDKDVSAFLRRLTGDEATASVRDEEPDGRTPIAPSPVPPDEDPLADTYVIDGRGDAQAAPRHQRPTVPLKGIEDAIAQKEAARISKPRQTVEPGQTALARGRPAGAGGPAPAPPSNVGVPGASVGMRRGVLVAVGLFALIAAAAGVIAVRARAEAPPRLGSAAPDAPKGAAPVAADAGTAPGVTAAVEGDDGVRDAGGPDLASAEVPVKAEVSPEQVSGTLVVRVTPWAQVIIDGQRRGEVDGVRSYKLPPGKHRIRFEHTRGTQEMVVAIEPAKSASREFNAFKLH